MGDKQHYESTIEPTHKFSLTPIMDNRISDAGVSLGPLIPLNISRENSRVSVVESPKTSRHIGGYWIGTDGIRKTPEERPSNKSSENNMISKKFSNTDLIPLCALGKGQSGSVNKVFHLSTLSYLAVKTMDAKKESSTHQVIHELETFRGVNSPYLVSFHGAYMDSQKRICIALEYMDCGSLEGFVDHHGGSLPEDIIRHCALYIINGLKYLKSLRMLHRDLKPGNILVHHTGAVKITDFGLVKTLEQRDRTQSMKGTLVYMDPDRLRVKDYSYPSDIWSFGLCLVYCATGENPFQNINEWDAEVLDKGFELRKEDPTKSRFSDELCSFVDACLNPDSDKRFTAEELLNHAFLDDRHKPDLKGTPRWEKFCELLPCPKEELKLVTKAVAEKLLHTSCTNIQPYIERLAEITNHSRTNVEASLRQKLNIEGKISKIKVDGPVNGATKSISASALYSSSKKDTRTKYLQPYTTAPRSQETIPGHLTFPKALGSEWTFTTTRSRGFGTI